MCGQQNGGRNLVGTGFGVSTVFGIHAVVVIAVWPAVVGVLRHHIEFIVRQLCVRELGVAAVDKVAPVVGHHQFTFRTPRHTHGIAQSTCINGSLGAIILPSRDFPNRARGTRTDSLRAGVFGRRAIGVFAVIGLRTHTDVQRAIVTEQDLFEWVIAAIGQFVDDDLGCVFEGLGIDANDARGFTDVHPAVRTECDAMRTV